PHPPGDEAHPGNTQFRSPDAAQSWRHGNRPTPDLDPTASPPRLDRAPTHRCHGLYRGHPESREPKGETMTPNTALDTTTGTEPNRSIRTASLTAGIALLLLSALSIF